MEDVLRFRLDQYLSLLLVIGALVLLPPFYHSNTTSYGGAAQAVGEKPFPVLKKQIETPVYIGDDAAENTVPASASALYIMDVESGAILFQENAQASRYPASTAKMMTALAARKTYSLDTVLTVKKEAFTTGTTAKLQLGEQLTVRELLHALLIPSGNDASFILANNHPLGYQGFVNEMNELAEKFHLDQTHFGNPSGLDAQSQTATARDLAILAKELMKDDVLRQIVSIKNYTVTDVTGKITHPVQNTQELLNSVDGVVGIKTGTTQFAGENLITEVDRDGHSVIIVTLGSHDRFNETKQLIEWVFNNFEWKKIGK
jgi:serine-type D-Ala-D-Ala carboxypeptidase (penicillin-binding protein 5/6)